MAARHSPRFLAIVQDAKTRIRECGVDDVKRRMDAGETLHLLDVREESEYAKGHLPGAKSLGKGIIERDIEQLFPDPAAPLLLYCGGGYRSALAADALGKMGYTNVTSIDGGWRVWNQQAYPTEHGPKAE